MQVIQHDARRPMPSQRSSRDSNLQVPTSVPQEAVLREGLKAIDQNLPHTRGSAPFSPAGDRTEPSRNSRPHVLKLGHGATGVHLRHEVIIK